MGEAKIVLDCDPGHDDAIAMIVANKSEMIDLLGITVVAGNHTVEKTLKNALKVADFADINVPIYKGAESPLFRQQVVAEDIHGKSGLGGPGFPTPKKEAANKHAVRYIIEQANKFPEELTIVATGPLTNIAMALKLAPSIKNKVKKIVLMGGSYGIGNVTASAEFNIYADAEAADIVFASDIPLIMAPLDLTHQALATEDIIEEMKKIDNAISDKVVGLLNFFRATYEKNFGFKAPPLHDPCAIAKVIDPEVFKVKNIRVDIETEGHLTYGRTVFDFYNKSKKAPNAKVGIELDKGKFWDIIINNIKKY